MADIAITVLAAADGRMIAQVRESAKEVRRLIAKAGLDDWVVLTNNVGKEIHLGPGVLPLVQVVVEATATAPPPTANGKILVPADPFGRPQ